MIKSLPIKNVPKGKLTIVYCKSLIDPKLVQSLILPFLSDHELNDDALYNLIQSDIFEKKDVDEAKIITEVLEGKLMAITNYREKIYFFDLRNPPARQPEESVVEVSITGPKDGFIEDIDTNIALIRKRLKTPTLVTEDFTIGKRSNTKVSLLYINDVINEDLLTDVRNRLSSIDIDVLQSRDELSDLITAEKYSLFPLTNFTGRPDFVTESLNQGRFSIVMDGAPTVIIAPINLTFLIKTAEDSNVSFYYASVERLLRIFGLLITIFLPGFYTALITHNVGQLPLPLIATITISKMGLPFSTLLEMITMFIMFELFKEAGARLPKGVGQTVAVIGGLIIGDAAIRAGITSPTLLIVVGVTAIASFTLVNATLSGNIFFIRFAILLISYFFGIFGFLLSVICLLIHLSKLKSFGSPYLTLGKDMNFFEVLKSFIRFPITAHKKRNNIYSVKDNTRTGGKK
ncbi:hypothetical protein J2S17_000226 [Cytobacillus purgationiresistens]|uniref:Spore germination protein n=2 Tax=Cytobacillus purgationiresistens TaxID=863449 RepID=A0ABU0AC33_9BACI|nr:hypothetical protein [Cytobacillus purgationiresistens]